MRTGKTLAIVTGAIAALIAVSLGVVGAVLIVLHATARDDSGYYNSPNGRYETQAAAITSERIDLGTNVREGWGPLDRLGTARIQVRARNGAPTFVGIARQSDVDRYLATTAHDQITSVSFGPFIVRYRPVPGGPAVSAPGAQTFWVAAASGAGSQSVTWPVEHGSWAVVVMNADGSPVVDVNARAGIATGILLPIGLVVLGIGLLFGAAATALLIAGLRRPRAAIPTQQPAPGTYPPSAPSLAPDWLPLRFEARLDPPLSRWMWLVKWLLAIPHAVVLAFLWLAFSVLTVVAGVAILFTGRYPRAIFDFNVGVLRWTWRVTFYAVVFGTDRYPPFSLQPDPTYPADLDVAYPRELSRPLVLVKWWLLVFPHILIVSIFGGGLAWWTFGESRNYSGPGLITILCLVAGVVLAVRGRYPQSVFDLVMGLQRWTYRVVTYAALMRDEYPPFRLDQGGREPREEESLLAPQAQTVQASDPQASDPQAPEQFPAATSGQAGQRPPTW
ncbi:MAG TPA: DUF4389 domain-containing protein [Frankiaceae bacterium]|nr:DUF4389 domain-containing protein [Frankiaceae bacterium]